MCLCPDFLWFGLLLLEWWHYWSTSLQLYLSSKACFKTCFRNLISSYVLTDLLPSDNLVSWHWGFFISPATTDSWSLYLWASSLSHFFFPYSKSYDTHDGPGNNQDKMFGSIPNGTKCTQTLKNTLDVKFNHKVSKFLILFYFFI